jgi:hypothetical protein
VVLEDLACDEGDMDDLAPIDPRHRVEVDAQLVGVCEIVGAYRMRIEVDAAEVDGPHQTGGVVEHGLLRRRAGCVLELRDIDVVRAVLLGRPFLEDRFLGDALDEAFEDHRALGDAAQRPGGDGQVVLDQVELGDADIRKDDLVGMGDQHLLVADLHVGTLRRGCGHAAHGSYAALSTPRCDGRHIVW